MPCEARIQSGERRGQLCGNPQKHNTGTIPTCGVHHIAMMRNPEYRLRHDQTLEQAAAERAQQLAQEQQQKERRYQLDMAQLESPTIFLVFLIGNDIMNLWEIYNIPTFDIPKAYTFLQYYPMTHEAWNPILRALVTFRALINAFGYNSMSNEQRELGETIVRDALQRAGEIDLGRLEHDEHRGKVDGRIHREELERLRQEHERRRQEAEAQREAEFQRRLREEPVVFRRDPEGGIDLAAFANDTQNIHRSSVQNATENAVRMLLERPLLPEQDTLEQIYTAWYVEKHVRWSNEDRRDLAHATLTNDYYNTAAFNVPYGDVLDRVWAFIQPSEHKKELCKRLAQEVWEGRAMCSNGKMARLVNVLQGFDESLNAGPSAEVLRTMFQNKIALVANRPLEERQAAAEALFAEYNIPAEERNVWLEPLLEA
jgi:hypothetical protein